MKYLSVCSGIEAATVAWHPLGWRAWAYSEIENFPRAVLKHHYPNTPNHGDMTRFAEWPDATIDLLVGGTPCQSFSVAGLRKGLDDPRGNLMLTFGAIAAKYRPRWLVWENVPGVLSSNGGRDFGTFLGMLGQLGYGFAYRILDAQFCGVPQRRRRVFVVGYLGDWRCAAAVLFERHSLSGHPAPRREAGKIAPTIPARSLGGGGLGTDFDCDGGLIAGTLQASGKAAGSATQQDAHSGLLIAHALRGEGFDAGEDGTGRGIPLIAHAFDARQSDVIQYGDKTGPLDTDGHTIAVAFDLAQITSKANRTRAAAGLPAGTLAKDSQMHVAQTSAVRRLTPQECERLQGFPDDYTLIRQGNGKPAADGPRYKALGNSMAVPCMRWIGERIQAVELIKNEQRKAA